MTITKPKFHIDFIAEESNIYNMNIKILIHIETCS